MKVGKNKRNNSILVFNILIILSIMILTFGFSAFQAGLDIYEISAFIRPQKDIRITQMVTSSVTYSSQSNMEEYSVKSFASTINLPNNNSTVTYDITITNIGNIEMGILDITGLPSNLTYSISNYTVKDILCDDQNNTKCTLGSNTTLHITIGYAANGYNSNNTIYNIEVLLDFEQAYSITYDGFSNASGLPTTILNGEIKTITFNNITSIPPSVTISNATGNYISPTLTLINATDDVTITRNYSITYVDFTGDTSGLISVIGPNGGTITFNSTTGIPNNITVTGATGSYVSPTLTISNITGNIIVAVVSGNIQVIDNPDGTTTTITTTENENGSTTTNSVTTDQGGNTLSETETTTNTDDSSSSTTTNYDSTGNETGHTSSETDTNGNTSTQEVTVVNGNEVVTGYTVTTPASDDNTQSGLEVENGTGIDTGILALDGNAFEIDLVAKYNVVKNGVNSGKYVLAALEPISTGSTSYKGFAFSVTKSNARVGLYASSTGSTVSSSSNGATWAQRLQQSSNLTTGNVIHTLHIVYTPGTGNNSGTIRWTIDGTTYTTTNSTSVPTTLSNATITVGTLGVEHTKDMGSMEIISFNVTKTVS